SAATKWLTATARFVRTHAAHFTHALAACVGCDAPHHSPQCPPVFPTDEPAYARLPVVARLLVLHTVAELVIAHHDTLLSAGTFNNLALHRLRLAPFATDAVGNAYWYFDDCERVYREPSHAARENAQKLLHAQQHAREKHAQRQQKEHRRRVAQQKKLDQQKRKEERLRRNAQKWAPRVAASRVTRAAKRAQTAQSEPQPHLQQQQQQQQQPQQQQKTPAASRSSTRRKRSSAPAEPQVELASQSSSRTGSAPPPELQPHSLDHQREHAPARGRRGRRRNAPADPPTHRASKRPRNTEPAFSDPHLRVCTQWQLLTSDAASLRDIIHRFNGDEHPSPAERALVRKLTEHILPEIEQLEAKRRRELEKKQRAEFMMMNQKRSSRVQAITERKQMQARQAAQREEQQRFEEERIAAHNAKIANTLALEEKEQSNDIMLARNRFGLEHQVARDEEQIQKNEVRTNKLLAVQVRRSSRSTRGVRSASKERVEHSEHTGDVKDEIPSAVAKHEAESTLNTAMSESAERSEKKRPETEQSLAPEETSQFEQKTSVSADGLAGSQHAKRTENGAFSESPKAVPAESVSKTSSGSGRKSEHVERISSCPLETAVGKEYQWDYNHDDGMPVFVLDKFFFAYRENFGDAPLEESEFRGADMFGLGVLIPPSRSEPQASRVEIPSIMDWVIEYGSSPKLWVKSKRAWYELRSPAVEYREVFATARRKYELCVRIAIIGETMRGSQLDYDSIISFLGMRYGDMKSYREADVLEERMFIMAQMATLNRRSLQHSGFIKSLNKKIREDKRREHLARARVRSQKATAAADEMGDVQDGPDSRQSPEPVVKEQSPKITLKESADSDAGAAVAPREKEEMAAPKKRRRRPSSTGKVAVPRAVSSIMTSLLNAATKSSKPARKRKRATAARNGAPTSKSLKREADSLQGIASHEKGPTVPKDRTVTSAAAPNQEFSNGSNVKKCELQLGTSQVNPNASVLEPQVPKKLDPASTDRKSSFHRPENGKTVPETKSGPTVVNGEHTPTPTKHEAKLIEAKPMCNGLLKGKEMHDFCRTEKEAPQGRSHVPSFETNGMTLHRTKDIVAKTNKNHPNHHASDSRNCKAADRFAIEHASEKTGALSRNPEVNGVCDPEPRATSRI
ncbi:unnamed protein product, partial [Agarophyton chilense]